MSAAKFLTATAAFLVLTGLVGCGDIKSPTFQPKLLELKVCEQTGDSCPSDGASCNAAGASNPTLIPLNRSADFCALGRFEVLQEEDDEFSVGDAWRNVTSRVKWSSANPSALSVSKQGRATGLSQTDAVAVIGRLSGSEAQSLVRVTAPALEEVDIVPSGSLETLVGAQIQFQCVGSYSGACDESGSSSCDITDAASFSSSNSNQLSVTNDGLADALATTAGNAPVDVTCSGQDTSRNPPVARVSDPPAQVTVCGADSITSLEIVPATLTIATGQTQQLGLIANYTSCRTNEPAQLDVTPYASWLSSDDTIASVDSGGLLSALDGGTTDVTGSFAGLTSDPLTVIVKFAEVQRIDIIGPVAAVAGLNVELEYQATAILQDVDTGEEIGSEVLANSPATPFASWASDSSDVNFADPNVGIATLEASALPQAVEITATYKGVSGSFTTQVVDLSALKSMQLTPDVACVGDELSTGMIGDPVVQLNAYGTVEYLPDPDGEGPEVAAQCFVDTTNVSTWSVGGADLTSALLSNLFLLGDVVSQLLGDCDGTIPLNIGEDPSASPVQVSDTEPTKGQVSGNESTMNAVGGACVQASFNDLNAFASVLAAADLQALCAPLLASPAPSADDNCAPVIEQPSTENQEAGSGR